MKILKFKKQKNIVLYFAYLIENK